MAGKGYLVPNRSYLFGISLLDSQHFIPELPVLRNLSRLPIAAGIKFIKRRPNSFGGGVVWKLENVDAVRVLNALHR